MRLTPVLCLALLGCAHARHVPSSQERAVDEAIKQANTQFLAAQLTETRATLAHAQQLADGDVSLLASVGMAAAAVDAFEGNLDGAIRVVLDQLAAAVKRGGGNESHLHDRMIFLREASGDFP